MIRKHINTNHHSKWKKKHCDRAHQSHKISLMECYKNCMKMRHSSFIQLCIHFVTFHIWNHSPSIWYSFDFLTSYAEFNQHRSNNRIRCTKFYLINWHTQNDSDRENKREKKLHNAWNKNADVIKILEQWFALYLLLLNFLFSLKSLFLPASLCLSLSLYISTTNVRGLCSWAFRFTCEKFAKSFLKSVIIIQNMYLV